jgi:hypothetical protein
MNKEKYNQIIDEAYETYLEKKTQYDSDFYEQSDFILSIKTDSEFSERWGLKIEERELSLEERKQIVKNKYFQEFYWKIVDDENDETTTFEMNKRNIPTKLITVTYNNETIESYE